MHVAVILPEGYRGGTLRGAMNIARMLALGSAAAGEAVDVTFGHLDDPSLYSAEDFAGLRELGIGVRPFRREVIDGAQLNGLYHSWLREHEAEVAPQYAVFNDGISNFEDADFWLIVSDRVQSAIPPHRRYGVVVYDYIQRYVPEILGSGPTGDDNWLLFEQYAEVTRRAAFVLCTTEQTRRDCIACVGVPADRVVVVPMEFDLLDDGAAQAIPRPQAAPYILWTANATEHKNHLRVLDGLERYFEAHPDSPLQVVMSGQYTHLFSRGGESDHPDARGWFRLVREKLHACPEVERRLRIVGNVSDAKYASYLRHAEWLLHGALYDNGTFSILEAAAVGVPSVSSLYPAILEQCRNFGVQPALFDPWDSQALAATLEEALPRRADYVARLPGRPRLASRNYRALAPEYWQAVRGGMERVAP